MCFRGLNILLFAEYKGISVIRSTSTKILQLNHAQSRGFCSALSSRPAQL
uniref:Uncharacterized protein n=1 Tax=Anguilla anguilla TaxID=7936 RepID=A0A0E9TXP6_ANGAN